MPRLRHLAVAASLALLPAPLAAQSPVNLTVDVFGGVNFPSSDLFDVSFPGVATLTIGHESGLQFGGRLGVWPTRRFGIEAEGAYALSDVEIDGFVAGDTTVQAGTVDGNIFFGSLNLVLVLIDPPLDPLAVFISGGAGLVSRSGTAFDIFEDNSNIAGVLGIGLRYGVARGIRLRVDVKDYISSFEDDNFNQIFIDLGTDPGSQLQNDLLISVGLEFLLSTGV